MKSYVYLHGFASSPASSKARYFQARMKERGLELLIPALDGGDFEHLTLSRQLDVVGRTLDEHGAGKPGVLIGSSMGGYLAALYAERHPEVERVVLLAPAFNFPRRWAARAGPVEMERWKREGALQVFHYGYGGMRPLDWGLMRDAATYPAFPEVRQPALVLQGTRDDVVPAALAERFCEMRPSAQLRLFPCGHEMTEALAELWAATEEFLFA